MAGRTIWKGNIHLRGLEIPVKLHTAVKEERVQFHLLHKRDHVRLHQQMVCAYENTPVPPEEQVKGFELEEGKYVLVDQADLEKVEPEESRTIEVHEFVKSGQIEPVFRSRAYYLEPDNANRPYIALLDTLAELGLEGICTWTMRKRSYVGAIQARGKALRLGTLRYADEVIPVAALDLEKIPLSEKELKVGSDLIKQLTGPFHPQKFENEHEKKLRNLVDRKARGEKIAIFRPRRLKPTPSDNLLKTLEASLKKAA